MAARASPAGESPPARAWPGRLERWAIRHWLALLNTAAGIFAGLPLLAPLLLAVGWSGPAVLIYAVYRTTCHQWPGRSYFLFGPRLVYSMDDLERMGLGMAHEFLGNASLGFKMAYCERNFAIYTTIFLAGLLYALLRRRVRPLPIATFGLLLLPILLDGLTQLVGLRESSWELRTLTGALAGLAAVGLVYPRLERAFRLARYPRPAPAASGGACLADASRRPG
jgi:uncharacterized membrane protein